MNTSLRNHILFFHSLTTPFHSAGLRSHDILLSIGKISRPSTVYVVLPSKNSDKLSTSSYFEEIFKKTEHRLRLIHIPYRVYAKNSLPSRLLSISLNFVDCVWAFLVIIFSCRFRFDSLYVTTYNLPFMFTLSSVSCFFKFLVSGLLFLSRSSLTFVRRRRRRARRRRPCS